MHSKISDILTELEELLDREHLYYGHGTSSARDEALAMVLSVFDLNYPLDNDLLAILPSSKQWLDLNELLSQRILNKIPLPYFCLLYTSPSPRDQRGSRMPSSA